MPIIKAPRTFVMIEKNVIDSPTMFKSPIDKLVFICLIRLEDDAEPIDTTVLSKMVGVPKENVDDSLKQLLKDGLISEE